MSFHKDLTGNDLHEPKVHNIDVHGNVDINTPVNGQTLVYDSVSGTWKNGTPNGMPTKQFFYRAETNNNQGDYRNRSVDDGAQFRFVFFAPHDFNTLVSLQVIFIADTAITGTGLNLNSDYGAIGENYSNHSESQNNVSVSASAGDIVAGNLSSVFSNLAAQDFCGIRIRFNTGTTNKVLGILLRYT